MDMDTSSVVSSGVNTPKRSLLVIDGSYLLISAKDKINLDYVKLINELQMKIGVEVCKSIIYI